MKIDHFIFEATTRCRHRCLHCYNVWKRPCGMPDRELPTPETLALLDRMLAESGASLVTLSGGEPLLRPDLFEIVEHLGRRGAQVNLITCGDGLDDAAIARLAGRVALFELPLLAPEAALHDRLSGAWGAFDRATLAIAALKEAGQRVVAVFVATRLNLDRFQETAELAVALGADGMLFNRFNPGGAARIEELQASPEELFPALDQAQEIRRNYGIPVQCSIPMPPCLFDRGRWPDLGFGFCPAGTAKAYFTLGPTGDMRPCNHSPTVLGNLGETSFEEMATGAALARFSLARPSFCKGCRLEATCQGGCKAAAEVCSGGVEELDPFLAAYRHQAVRPQ